MEEENKKKDYKKLFFDTSYKCIYILPSFAKVKS